MSPLHTQKALKTQLTPAQSESKVKVNCNHAVLHLQCVGSIDTTFKKIVRTPYFFDIPRLDSSVHGSKEQVKQAEERRGV